MSTPVFVSASERNKQPILEQLRKLLPARASVLEIGSGWGQHAIFFTRAMPGWRWLPSDRPAVLDDLNQQLLLNGAKQLRKPYPLDVLASTWPDERFDVVYSANTAHIMSWPEVCAMFAGVGDCLARHGLFCLYGPFNVNGKFTAPSNEAFDQDLRSRDPVMGLRDLSALESLAAGHQLKFEERISMPANNFLLAFRAQSLRLERQDA